MKLFRSGQIGMLVGAAVLILMIWLATRLLTGAIERVADRIRHGIPGRIDHRERMGHPETRPVTS